MMKVENLIVGGSAAGLKCAAAIDSDTIVLEEHSEIGKPVQCSGIVTSSIKEVTPIKNKLIVNKVRRFSIKAGKKVGKKELEFKVKEPNLVLDREMFDKDLFYSAENKGAKILRGYRFMSNKNNVVKAIDLESKKEIKIEFDNLIGADGPFSNVAKNNGFYEYRRLVQGIQFRAELKNDIEPDLVEVFPEAGDFGWVLPENERIARIGAIGCNRNEFESFLKKEGIKNKIKRIIEYQCGTIPYYDPKIRFQNITAEKKVFLVGDSAGMIKNTSGGGLFHGLKAAKLLAKCLNSGEGDKYSVILRKEIVKDLKLHYHMRNVMNKFKDQDWEMLISLLKREKVKEIIETFDRDRPKNYIMKLLLREPRLMYFSRYML